MPSTSQSVARSFSIFEQFASQRKALTAHDIARQMDVPRSTLAALLKTLVDLEMLSIDRKSATYLPTAKFAELGSWLVSDAVIPPDIRTLAAKLRNETGETVTLGAYHEMQIELVLVELSEKAISFRAERGQRFSVWGTGVGTAYLSTLDKTQIRSLYRRAVDTKKIDPKLHNITDILERAQIAQSRGYHSAHGAVFEGASAISAPTGQNLAGRPLVLSITGPSERMRAVEHALGTKLVAQIECL